MRTRMIAFPALLLALAAWTAGSTWGRPSQIPSPQARLTALLGALGGFEPAPRVANPDNMPMAWPDPRFDSRIRVVAPRADIDFKIRIVEPFGRMPEPSERLGVPPDSAMAQCLDLGVLPRAGLPDTLDADTPVPCLGRIHSMRLLAPTPGAAPGPSHLVPTHAGAERPETSR